MKFQPDCLFLCADESPNSNEEQLRIILFTGLAGLKLRNVKVQPNFVFAILCGTVSHPYNLAVLTVRN